MKKRRTHPPVPWFHRRLADLVAHRANLDADHLDRMARGVEPWDNEILRMVVETFEPLADSNLPSSSENSTIRTMRTEIDEPRMGRPIKGTKLAAALIKANMTLTELAHKAKRSTASVRSWSYPKSDPSHRPAPRAIVEMFQSEFGIPLTVWPEIVG